MKQLLTVLFAAMFAVASVSAVAQEKKADPAEKKAMKSDKDKKKAKPKAKSAKKKSDGKMGDKK